MTPKGDVRKPTRGSNAPASSSRLAKTFAAHLGSLGAPCAGDRVIVAVSGGLDSLTLLHILRFGAGVPEIELEAAHFDHRMRPDSGADAKWVADLAKDWGIPLTAGVAETPCTSEDHARLRRYDFLDNTRLERGATWVMTAHHADDQAETVLFRIIRGTGVQGLAGIPDRREPSILRPLLRYWRVDLEEYATALGLTPREDPSNTDLSYARNYLRHQIIPSLERDVAPRVRSSLVRLAERVSEDERAWAEVLSLLLTDLDVQTEPDRISVALPSLARYDSPVRVRVLRELARRLGGRLDSAATQAALTFSEVGASGRETSLPGGVMLVREFDRLVLTRAPPTGHNSSLEVLDPHLGDGTFVVGGRAYQASWSQGEIKGRWVEHFGTGDLAFPLHLREWQAGDRMTLAYGRKKLKKLFSEARIPVRERRCRVVLADARGRVLWVPGVACSTISRPIAGERTFAIGIVDAEPS